MKRLIGMAIFNWLRKPANREKVKRAARRAMPGRSRRRGSESDPRR